jgi:anthranilate phosphoribosyltransferase
VALDQEKSGVLEAFVDSGDQPCRRRTARAPIAEIRGGTAAENAELIRKMFEGERGARRDIVAINAGAALVVTGAAKTLREGAESAVEAMQSGAAMKKLDEMIEFGEKTRPNVS